MAGCATSVVMRARMVTTPITPDEGGYLAIARAWAHGRVLYRDVWVDRPQGLLVLFRAWDWLSGGHTSSIRVMAMLFGALLVISTAIIVRQLHGHRAARWTALICGAVSAAPVLEGHIPNGELLSGAVVAAGLAVALVGLTKPSPTTWMIASGVLAGVAFSFKQTGFDGLLTLLLWFAIIGVGRPLERRHLFHAAAGLLAGFAAFIAVLAVHGALIGWHRWWWAVVGYRSDTLSLFNHPYWVILRRTARSALVVLGAGLVVGLGGLVTRLGRRPAQPRRQRWRRELLLPGPRRRPARRRLLALWLLLAAPISALAGATIGHQRRLHAACTAIAVTAPCIAISLWVFLGNPARITVRAASDPHAVVDRDVARWFVAHRQPGDNLFVMCTGPAIYADAHQDPGFPYLWLPEVYLGPGAAARMHDYLTDPASAPTYIAQYQSIKACDPKGLIKPIVDAAYHEVAKVDGVAILRRQPPTPTG